MSAGTDGYRSDIDGLRAVAVASVVLFHAGVPGFGGGFVGVDIFFVISGYLITSIIAREIRDGRFSIAAFYERRTRRIFPALFAMLAASLAAAVLIQLPHEFEEFGDSLAAATLFVSNLYFWQATDYFSGPAHLKPLLHTWSLAVEEQYYIVFPLLLLALARWRKGDAKPVLIFLTALSFLISVVAVGLRPPAAFYLLPSRFWELMIGALLALGAVPAATAAWQRQVLGVAGLALVSVSVALYSNATAFPGWAAVVPCLGAACLIHAGAGGRDDYVAARLLSWKPVVFVGLISYSLYLWHWPVLVFARLQLGEPPSAVVTAALLALAVVLSILSWKFIEQPCRVRRMAASRPQMFGWAGAAMAITLLFAGSATTGGGWPTRHPDYAPPQIAGLGEMHLGTCFLKDSQTADDWAGPDACRSGKVSGPAIVLWGDSFAAHLAPGLAAEAGQLFRIYQITAGGCPPVAGVDLANRPQCRAINDRALDTIAAVKPAVVLLSARWDTYLPRAASLADVAATVTALTDMGARVVVVGDSPTFDFANPYDFTYRSGRHAARAIVSKAIDASRLRGLLPSSETVEVFDPAPLFCTDGRCNLKDEDGFLFFDGGHYSVSGSRRVAEAVFPTLVAAAGKPRLADLTPDPPPAP